MIGKILGNRYRILRDIGSGGMARVYLSEDMNEGRLVAVKVLYPHFGEDVSYIQRFIREAKLAEGLDNQHVVKVLDYGSTRETHYLVMEYVEGRDLREMLNERGPLSWEEALSMIDQVCEALEEANRHNIVHRDIKPQNIMITDSGSLKVLDFGIARSRMLPSLTQSGFVGSPYYISPEQAMGEEVDIRSDIYSTGIVLYELLSGRVPFDAKSPWSIISQHIANEPPQIEVSEAFPAQVNRLLQRMVAKNTGDRFQSPTSLRQAVDAILKGEDLPADLGTPPPANTDRVAMADSLYRRAVESIEQEDWQKAVMLLNQVLDLNADHPQALEKRTEAGTQARLAALYNAASRAMEGHRWQEAIDELTEILEIAAEYKDSVKLLVQARDAAERQNVDLQLSELYDSAVAHFESGEYDKAEDLFGKIRKISPVYRRADALWAESRRRKSRKGGFERLNQNLAKTQLTEPRPKGRLIKFKRSYLTWIGATIGVVVLIIGAVWVVNLNNELPDTTPSADDLYVRAQIAYQDDDTREAEALLKQALSLEPRHDNALNLQETIDQREYLEDQLSEATQAYAADEWTAALEILKELHDNYANFETETVTGLLCNAALARGQDRLTRVANPRDRATISAALADFRVGQQACENREDLETQVAFASSYLDALQPDTNADTMIEILRPIINAEPTYAGGQAVQNLYRAYLNRGDLLRQQGLFDAAIIDYEAALALGLADSAEAQNKLALAQLPPTTAPTPTVASGQEAAQTPTPVSSNSEAVPTNTSETAVASGLKYNAPVPLGPDQFASFSGEFDEIILTWEAIDLAANEYYDVTVRYFVGDEPRYWGAPLTDNSWRVPVEAGYGQAGQDEFSWWVTVRQTDTNAALSPPSNESYFIWRPG